MAAALIHNFVDGNYKKFADAYIKQVNLSQKVQAESLKIQNTFKHYVHKNIVDDSSKKDFDLQGENSMLSVLFCDARDFTKISNHLSPKATLNFLNSLLPILTEVVMKNHGIIYKFYGR